ncbi:P-loop NTPase fold protein [Segnochrobactraceae bacterium EtOH-i3]
MTVSAVAKRFRLSQTIKAVLRSSHAFDPFVEKRIGIAGFLRATLCDPPLSARNDYVVDIFGPDAGEILARAAKHELLPERHNLSVADALEEAFEEAQDLRRQTGGNDQYIGLRYVLFVLLTSRNDAIRQAMRRVLALVEVDPDRAAKDIARDCLGAREAGESEEAWQQILTERGFAAKRNNKGPHFITIKGKVFPSRTGGKVSVSDGVLINKDDTSKAEALASDPTQESLTLSKQLPPRPPIVALLRPDDPWASDARDATGSAAEASAFADMVVARQFRPPLAVGVFGDWGSGKSFFLRQIHDAITRRNDKTQPLANDSPVQFCEHVVQIRFNAWHYAETNLWASLVDHIFTSLHDWMSAAGKATQSETLLGSLTTARHLTVEAATALVAAREIREQKRTALQQAEATLATARAKTEGDLRTHLRTAFKTLIEDPETKKVLEKTATGLGFPELATNVDAFANVTDQLKTEVGRLDLLRGGIIRQLTGWAAVFLVLAASAVLPILFGWIAARYAPGTALGASIAGVMTATSGALAWTARRSQTALDRLQTYRTKSDATIAEHLRKERESSIQAAAELATAEAEVTQAEDALREANERATQAAIAYRNETGANRILHFVRERINAGTYTRHLSFIASIRRDFEELTRFLDESWRPSAEAEKARQAYEHQVDALLKMQGDAGLDEGEREMLKASLTARLGSEARPFQRIVLYVDDLDRCRPAQVVAMLEAIQLLLTYPIFVVFVAVDVRWLRASLADQLQRQLSNGTPAQAKNATPAQADTDEDSRATTTDYLEKIFQIPYWVRSFGDEASRSLLRQHIGDQPAVPTQQAPEGMAGKTPAARKADNRGIVEAAPASPEDAAGEIAPAAEAPPKAAVASPPTDTDTPEPGMTHALQLTTAEIAALEAVAPFLTPLPRRVVRFLNTYRILKGSLAPADQAKLEDDGHRALIALLAIAFLAEEDFPEVARLLCSTEQANPKADVLDTVATLPEITRSRIRACLGTLGNPAPAALSSHVARVARFTFYQGT